MSNSTKTSIIASIVAGLIFLFTYTAASKLMHPGLFRLTLEQSTLLRPEAFLLSRAIPIIEIGIVVLLALPQFQNVGLWSSLALLTVFTIYIGYMLGTSSHLPCSCGGVIKQLSWKQHLGFNLMCMALAGLALHLNTYKKLTTAKLSV